MNLKLLILGILMTSMSSIPQAAQKVTGGKEILIAYFSYSGNTRAVAQEIQKNLGADRADIFEITPVKKYPSEYNAVVDQAKREINAKFKPPLKEKVADISQYDTIIVGSPSWWATIAPPVSTFLSSYSLEGTTIALFITHEGSGLGVAAADVKKLCPKSPILEGLAIRGSSAKNASTSVNSWLKKIRLLE